MGYSPILVENGQAIYQETLSFERKPTVRM
jgi:hypothetical protein